MVFVRYLKEYSEVNMIHNVKKKCNETFYACLVYYMVLIITYQKFRKVSALETDQNHTLINALYLLVPRHPEPFERQLVHYVQPRHTQVTPQHPSLAARIGMAARALSQYKDRLIYVWRFPC